MRTRIGASNTSRCEEKYFAFSRTAVGQQQEYYYVYNEGRCRLLCRHLVESLAGLCVRDQGRIVAQRAE